MRNMSDLKDKITQDPTTEACQWQWGKLPVAVQAQHAGQLSHMNSVFTVNSHLEIQLENTAKQSATRMQRYVLSDYVFGAQATMIVQHKTPQARCVSHFQLVSVPCVEQSYVLRGRSHAG